MASSPKILVVHDVPLTGQARTLVDKTLEQAGAKGWEHASVFQNSMTSAELKAKRGDDWIAEQGGLITQAGSYDKILFLGAMPLACYFGLRTLPKITKIRGRGMQTEEGQYAIATLSPRQCLYDPDYFRDLAFDVTKFVERDAPIPQPEIEVIPLRGRDMTPLYALKDASFVACDIETTGLDPLESRITAVGFAALHPDGTATSVIVEFEGQDGSWRAGGTQAFLESYTGELVFHNLKFDYKHLLHRFPGLVMQNPHDTMLKHYLLDERGGKYAAHGLKTLSRLYFDAPDYGIDMEEWNQQYISAGRTARMHLLDTLYEYQARDCVYTAMLHETIPVETPAINQLYRNLYVPAAAAFGRVELRGAPIDVPWLERKREALTEAIDDHLASLSETVFAMTGKEEFNPGSTQQLGVLLYEDLGLPLLEGKNDWKKRSLQPTTEKLVLKTLAREVRAERPGVAKLIDDVLAWRRDTKMKATYVDGLLRQVSKDGRIRGEFRLHGTETGRVSGAKPNLQNIPLEIMEAFIALDGWTLIAADYSQLELRVAAVLTGDETLVHTFQEDGDIHQEVAFALWGKPKEQVTKAERVLAKTLSFGSIYGLSAQGIAKSEVMSNLADQGIDVWSEKQIVKFQKQFETNFAGLYRWIEAQKKLGFQHRYVENPIGFRRRFPLILHGGDSYVGRQAVNTPIQGFAGQLTTRAVTHMDELFGDEYAQVLLTVHDSILVMAKDKFVEGVIEDMRIIMEKDLPEIHEPFTGKPLEYNVPFKAEFKTGRNWKECA